MAKSGSGLDTPFKDAIFASSGSGKAKAQTPAPIAGNPNNKKGK